MASGGTAAARIPDFSNGPSADGLVDSPSNKEITVKPCTSQGRLRVERLQGIKKVKGGTLHKNGILFTRVLAIIALLVLMTGCTREQITRTGQDRPTAPKTATVQADAPAGVISAGTTFAVRANENIDSNQPGGTYRAEVAQTIEDRSGKVLVPAGSPAELTVVDVSSGGVVGTRTISLALRSVTVNGVRHTIQTADTTEGGPAGVGTNRRTAEMVGGGAAIGALIGAIAGGGKGAAIGAAVGAAGGAATQVLTRGDTVRVPAETVMTFQLDQPWELVT
jgi:hypothetical protein